MLDSTYTHDAAMYSWYAEDCTRLATLSPLRAVRDHLLSALVSLIRLSLYTYIKRSFYC